MKRWEDDELDALGMIDEIKRLIDRAYRRKLLVLFIALCGAALLGVREHRRQRTYPATVVLSATEGEHAENGVAHQNANLTDYVFYAVFTDRALSELMEKHGHRPDLKDKNPRLRLDQFRDLIDISVYKNEFTVPRYAGSPPRAANIGIEFRYQDPDQALQIARELGDLVITRDAENRRERLESDLHTATESLSVANGEVNRMTRELAMARADFDAAVGRLGTERVRLESAEKGLVEALTRQKQALDEKNRVESRKNADKQSLELRFDRVDWGAPKIAVLKPVAIAKVAIPTFFLLLPLAALAVGAFDRRVYDERDLPRLGLRSLGYVRRARRG